MILHIYITCSLIEKMAPCTLGASRIGLPEGNQSGMPDSTVAVEQYNKLYAPVVRWGLKPSCLGEIPLFPTCPSGVAKLIGATFCGSITVFAWSSNF